MPRKSTKKENTTEPKVAKKRTTKKTTKTEVKEVEFNVSEMINWTDEECALKDKELHFSVAGVRDIFKSLKAVNDQLLATKDNLTLLKLSLAKGLMTGYKVTCPHCKREYVVNSMELNRENPILCKVCGTEYKENESISGIALIPDESIDNKIKDNETLTI